MSDLKRNLAKLRKYANAMKEAKTKSVAVGLPSEKVGGKIYGDGLSIIENGVIHEFGKGNVPRRSFLREPFALKKDEIDDYIALQFDKVFSEGRSVDRALGLVGVYAVNISRGAFTSQGYGQWQDIEQATKDAKGSSQVLIDTGTLRNSITWVVR